MTIQAQGSRKGERRYTYRPDRVAMLLWGVGLLASYAMVYAIWALASGVVG